MIPFKASPFTADAKKRWDRIPKWAQTGILDSVYCVKCLKSVPIVLETAKMQRDDLILRGKCKSAGMKSVGSLNREVDRNILQILQLDSINRQP